MSKNRKLLDIIATCDDEKKLQNWISNANREGAEEIEDAARRRRIEVRAAKDIDDPNDPVVQDFWKSITALENELSEERRKTIRLSRTRQKIARVGVEKTLADLALQAQPSDGYRLLKATGMLDLSAEAVVLRYPKRFTQKVLVAARLRLKPEE
ncbi:hypothetical protein GCM10008927_30400 [Amylibacter ulvae]|uniref:Phage protein n=1 Tax=Paramylibacter ulvae TaxID=1651968 RepID=A0ABQ3D8V5_9RHOB|nr:hypothetical protein [Amylibacter ulvae]GHA62942.1 hypothetical protein GCM10008927_30400 [Amylibacter ulvae]